MSKKLSSKLYIGTCSWKYDSWKGLVYPEQDKFNFLEEYAKHFNSVEIDQWFWSLNSADKISLPKEKDVESYAASVPDDFKFSIKVPNSITLTHFYKKNKTEPLKSNPHFLNPDLFSQFLNTLSPMKNKLGPLMFQFEYLNKEKMNSQHEFMDRFEKFLEDTDRNYMYAIEIRNPNYLNKNFFEFLNRNNISMVFLHGYYMPPVWETFQAFQTHLKNTVIFRLHGPDRSGIEEKTGGDWSKIVEPRDDEILKIVKMIQLLLSLEIDIYANVNNHFEGSAPLTIQKIRDVLDK
ncbi:MAG: DUF72 domain-containing protein [Ignavibacteriales bacterium]|nr:MAG: DUF72 domain-containing protein [Ignavibacteriales bacterium]